MEETKKSGFSTAGLVLGIIGVCTSFIPIINNLSFVMGILAVIFGIVALVKKSGKGKIIASIILGILAVVITINSQKALSDSFEAMSNDLDKASGNSTEEVLANDVEVSLGKFEVKEGKYSTDTKLVVKVKNKTSQTKSFNIQIEAVNADGSRITNDYVYANNLNAGQSQDFEIFTYVSSDKLETMKKATFKIVEASMY
ncbi:MAG: DUF4190 domain-containing protein [Clostridia bacterium]|nr:DUF4190 domain-containing protein [Clostridia bacterium]